MPPTILGGCGADATLRQALAEAGVAAADFDDGAEEFEELLQPDASLNLDDVLLAASPGKRASRDLHRQPVSGLDHEFYEALEVVHTHEYLLKNSARVGDRQHSRPAPCCSLQHCSCYCVCACVWSRAWPHRRLRLGLMCLCT